MRDHSFHDLEFLLVRPKINQFRPRAIPRPTPISESKCADGGITFIPGAATSIERAHHFSLYLVFWLMGCSGDSALNLKKDR